MIKLNKVEIKPGVYWVGGIDWNLRNFHGYSTKRGSTYNAYLIVDEKITLIDVTVVMAGDAQMDPNDLPQIIEPVASGSADYTKGNRLFYGDAWTMIPHYRYLGNSFLSLMTKIASGYWHIADSQSGYTAINLKALQTINWDSMYKRYGQPNDLLVRFHWQWAYFEFADLRLQL